MQQCWICGAPADSREHRLKKADLVRAYGGGPFRGPKRPIHISAGIQTEIQGPRADRLKYEPALCQQCNNARTQPFDFAYDTFMSWLENNEQRVLSRRQVNFRDVFGGDFEAAQRNLFKYFVKSFGCRLVDAGQLVPADLVDLLPKESFRTALKITFCVHEDILAMPLEHRRGFIGKSDLIGYAGASTPSAWHSFTWSEHVSWFTVCYWYGVQPEGGMGPPWIANAQVVYLGSIESLSDEERKQLTQSLIRNERTSELKDNCSNGQSDRACGE